MAERRRLPPAEDKPEPSRSVSRRVSKAVAAAETPISKAASEYFASGAEKDLDFISSGCVLLDEALGGGWAEGRIVNLVGDRSSGKTLLAVEACANFNRKHPEDKIRYGEAEAAFDKSYAGALGMPLHVVEFTEGQAELNTVEDFYNDIVKFIDSRKGRPGLYVLDSLDALSDEAEQGRELNEGTYGANKAKMMGQIFRRIVRKLEKSRVTLFVISQLRDKINVTFGETKTRSGGRALDFYATHIVWLAQIGQLKKTSGGVERPYGVNVRANIKKNKVGMPYRQVDFPVLFGYGVDDLTAGVEWLLEVKAEQALEELGVTKAGYKVRITSLRDKGGEPVREFREKLNKLVRSEWKAVEMRFLPKSTKY